MTFYLPKFPQQFQSKALFFLTSCSKPLLLLMLIISMYIIVVPKGTSWNQGHFVLVTVQTRKENSCPEGLKV